MPKIRRKSIENDFLLIFFLHAERGCRSIIYFNDFATPSTNFPSYPTQLPMFPEGISGSLKSRHPPEGEGHSAEGRI